MAFQFWKVVTNGATELIILYRRDLILKEKNLGDPCWALCISEFLAAKFRDFVDDKPSTDCWKERLELLKKTNDQIADGEEKNILDSQTGWFLAAVVCHNVEDLTEAIRACGQEPCAGDLNRVADAIAEGFSEATKGYANPKGYIRGFFQRAAERAKK